MVETCNLGYEKKTASGVEGEGNLEMGAGGGLDSVAEAGAKKGKDIQGACEFRAESFGDGVTAKDRGKRSPMKTVQLLSLGRKRS